MFNIMLYRTHQTNKHYYLHTKSLTHTHCFNGHFSGALAGYQNSSYPRGLRFVFRDSSPLLLTIIPRFFEAEVFTGLMPFLSPNQK